ncbi:NAD-dependent epimerase/dehydratase family protein [Rhizobium giardinii]|uniref:NAD-dependent epimerase/dehydratase family protein n=1 Tax=Rhizobium giardinii TaxID=56731 RepID=UPI003D6FFB8C
MNIAHDDPRNITVLVTGVSGFLAGHTALQLLKQGYRVRGSLRHIGKRDDVRDQLRSHIHPAGLDKLSFVEAELNSDAGWDAAVEGCRFVIHTASPSHKSERHLGATARNQFRHIGRFDPSFNVGKIPRDPALWFFRCGCAGCGGCSYPSDDYSRGRRPTIHHWRAFSLAQRVGQDPCGRLPKPCLSFAVRRGTR